MAANQISDDFTNDNGNENENIVGIENRTFPMPLGALIVSGLWKPTNLNGAPGALYKIYTLLSSTCIILLTLAIIANNVVFGNSLATTIENLYLILTFVNALGKGTSVYLRRGKIIRLLQNYMSDRMTAKGEEEGQIINESISAERVLTRFCIYLVTANDLICILNPFMHPDKERDLPVDAYVPCDRSGAACYWLAYLFQVMGYVNTSLLNLGCDCLLFNLIERLCANISVLEGRILRLPGLVERGHCAEVDYVKERVRDHHFICRKLGDPNMATCTFLEGRNFHHQEARFIEGFPDRQIKLLNNTFYEVVFVQFITSISILCTNIYLLTMQPVLSADFMNTFFFFGCVLLENFLYCWYGYKISVYSLHMSDAIFNMNWCILKKESKQMLSYVMFQTLQKIALFNSAIVSLTPESFLKILKVSYSAFNLLQQTEKK